MDVIPCRFLRQLRTRALLSGMLDLSVVGDLSLKGIFSQNSLSSVLMLPSKLFHGRLSIIYIVLSYDIFFLKFPLSIFTVLTQF